MLIGVEICVKNLWGDTWWTWFLNKSCILRRLMFQPWTFEHLLVINLNRNCVLVPPNLSILWSFTSSQFLPQTGGGLALDGVHLQHSSFFWPASTHVLEVSDDHSTLSLCSPTDPPYCPLFSPLSPFTPCQLMDCLAPPLPSLSPSLTLKQWGEKRRDKRRGKREEAAAHCSPGPLLHCCSSGLTTTSRSKRFSRSLVNRTKSRLHSEWLAGPCARWPWLCSWCSAWQQELGPAAPGPVAAPSPCSSAWKRMASAASRCWFSRRARMSQKCESGLEDELF